ncbi:MAG: hypothetical protein UX85_C0008G0045 [Candidatus Beckwithbacteria bacterium GW2011_GWB1_47_15]|uniref:DUF5673 domain-containing protein n=1 Tax=Candidatus Beckwithbacteria bacterium GW2011_GWB1_47_15 TaxID=1618371 RepID=A0A0G1RUC1_9BACT|nr:MAG: protein of unknown function with transmembrane region [Candidatus Beckwithbacteria bacterium GW2011_GWC1_49_16]KKU60671.1 MAG: hypothetical protein UX85_C0008G0045 [Candidatus Beckwithbacteria bacterium GW2011_GWB1_47_15]KKW03101.1 MAG: hypothetical protein UY37_C0007G0055 [Candidatus Beckwithbacteria bacterium GW2011_GWC2_49_11]OGD48443.1 MAG: hypothetical protein A2877_03325 [Candidatus Beckwithbacteria bacterium RIFCSPHIGHO2_01_FULL_49_39]OGD50532.1 MAG: hypothetical protein A3D86_00
MTALFRKPSPLKKEEVKESEAPKAPVKVETLLSWQAPVRPFKKRDREYYTTIGAIGFLLAVILLFLKEWLLIAVIAALMFVAYVLATVEPEKTSHEITTVGILTGDKTYKWEDLKRFWFETKWSDKILHVDTKLSFPGRLMLLLGDTSEEEVKKILEQHVQEEIPEATFMDRSAKWLSEKVPLEKES